MKFQHIILIGLVLFIFLPTPVRAQADSVEVIPIHHRSAAELLPVVRQMLGKTGTASAYDHQLVVKAPRKQLTAMEKLIEKLDIPRPLLRIDVWQGVADAGVSEGASIDAHNDKDAVRFGTEASAGGPGNPSGRFGYQIGNTQHGTEQVLHVLDGKQALITVGKEVPFTSAFAVMSGNKSGYAEQRTLRKVTTGFWVRPHLTGQDVELQIMPHLSSQEPGASDIVDSQHVATTVRVPLGRWYNLGGELRDSDPLSRAIVQWQAGAGAEERSIWIKVERQ
ncbi:MAG TPA: secretin N-terminal domain-containing protein [Desulfuromonadales bacterium]|nr:secretin N-terminal domain-containing protein [Desulfuromonadales bacterium]